MKIIEILIGAHYLTMLITCIIEAFNDSGEEITSIYWWIGAIIGGLLWPIVALVDAIIKLLRHLKEGKED